MQLTDYDTSHQYSAVVKLSRRITPDDTDEVREIVLDIEDPKFRFNIGQCIGVIVPGPHDMGHKHHFRLYSIADAPKQPRQSQIDICVKKVTYIDEYSGEAYPGIASNYLCNLRPGDPLKICGPYDLPFQIPQDKTANLIMIGMGTGIAPFRAFVRHIYDELGSWQGKVLLFYGARSGLESFYMNEQQNDFSQYYDQNTFQAFNAISPRPHWGDPVALDQSLIEQKQEVWSLIQQANTYVFVAGHEHIEAALELAFGHMAGSEEEWEKCKKILDQSGRWKELIY